MAEHKPREPEDQEYTGVGTTRSSDMGPPRDARTLPQEPSAVVVGATTSSHPADPNNLAINRSGSGGSGDEQNDEDGTEPTAA